jgi:hypothetical protein
VVVEAVLARAPNVLVAPVARDRDERGAVDAGGPQRARQRVLVHTGQPDVDEHQVGARAGRLRQRARAVVGDHDVVPEETEQRRERARRIDVVVVAHAHDSLAILGRDLDLDRAAPTPSTRPAVRRYECGRSAT